MAIKLRRATPPIAPPIMAPVLLEFVDVDDREDVALEGLSELVVEIGSGCFSLDVGVVDCGTESVVIGPVDESEPEFEVELVTDVGVELGEGVRSTVTVTDDAAWVCEIVFAASLESLDHNIPARLSKPERCGSADSSK